MSIRDWWFSLFSKDGTLSLTEQVCIDGLVSEACYLELAIQACVNLIANTVARSEFRTYERGVEVRKDNYYLFNVEPSLNRSASKFWRDVIHHLVYDNECLVLEQNGRFYVAESFKVQKFAFKDYVYTDVKVDGFQLSAPFFESDVFHFELHNDKIKGVVERLYQSYSLLIAASQTHYKRNNARRGVLNIPTSYPETEKAQSDLRKLLTDRFKRFFDADGSGAVLPLSNGMTYNELNSDAGSTKGSVEGRDIRAFIDDVFDLVAIAFQVPPQLLKGNVADTDKAVGNLLTFCINPLAELLTDEINRKMYGKEQYLQRTYVQLDTSRIRAVDIKDVANALDVLLRIGAYSIDDCLRIMGMEPFDTEWSRQRWMTRNYMPIDQAMEGGDTD